MIRIIIALIIALILSFVVLFIQCKTKKKLKEENDKLSKAIQKQKEIINAFVKAEREANKQKEKLGKGSDDERLSATLNILQDIEQRR